MKLIALLSSLALVAFTAFVLSAALDTQTLGLYAIAVSSLVLLVVVGDYAPHNFCGELRQADLVPFEPAPVRIESPAKLAA